MATFKVFENTTLQFNTEILSNPGMSGTVRSPGDQLLLDPSAARQQRKPGRHGAAAWHLHPNIR